MGDAPLAYELFGWREGDVEALREAVGAALSVDLEPHESSYLGEYYGSGLPGTENFRLTPAVDAEGEPREPDLPGFAVFLYANETARADEIRASIATVPGAEHLRSERY